MINRCSDSFIMNSFWNCLLSLNLCEWPPRMLPWPTGSRRRTWVRCTSPSRKWNAATLQPYPGTTLKVKVQKSPPAGRPLSSTCPQRWVQDCQKCGSRLIHGVMNGLAGWPRAWKLRKFWELPSLEDDWQENLGEIYVWWWDICVSGKCPPTGIHCKFSSSHFSHSVVYNSLQPHEPQHTRPPCPSPTPGVHPNPCPLCW